MRTSFISHGCPCVNYDFLQSFLRDFTTLSVGEEEETASKLILKKEHPQGPAVPKVSAEDTTLVAGNINDDTITVPVPKGTRLSLSVAGVHYNRQLLLIYFDWLIHEH